MNNDIRKAYAEIYEILKFMDTKYIEKIPVSFRENIEKEKDVNHKISIDPNVPLENQNLLEDTINILALLKLSYWCESQEEKQELQNILNKNEQEYQEKLKEKYNPNDLFKNKISNNEVQVNQIQNKDDLEPSNLTITNNKNFIQKLFQKIKNMFKKD